MNFSRTTYSFRAFVCLNAKETVKTPVKRFLEMNTFVLVKKQNSNGGDLQTYSCGIKLELFLGQGKTSRMLSFPNHADHNGISDPTRTASSIALTANSLIYE